MRCRATSGVCSWGEMGPCIVLALLLVKGLGGRGSKRLKDIALCMALGRPAALSADVVTGMLELLSDVETIGKSVVWLVEMLMWKLRKMSQTPASSSHEGRKVLLFDSGHRD